MNQVAFVTWFRKQYKKYRDHLTLGSFGENIGAKRMARLKAMGLTPGYPDLFLAVPSYEIFNTDIGLFIKPPVYHGFFIEMKTKTGKLSKAQQAIHRLLREQNYRVVTAYSWDEAKELIERYLEE